MIRPYPSSNHCRNSGMDTMNIYLCVGVYVSMCVCLHAYVCRHMQIDMYFYKLID